MNDHEYITQKHCTECNRKYQIEWRQNNRQLSNDYTRRYNRKTRSVIDKIKLDAGCADCGYNEHPVVLTFDHVRGEKLFTIGDSVGSKSLQKILAEIEKCEVVCANHHALRTHFRGQCGKKDLTTLPAPVLSDLQIIEIRTLYSKGGTSYRKLAKLFKVGYGTIDNVINFRGRFKEKL